MGSVIACLEKETGKKCFDTFRRSLDRERVAALEYDDVEREFMSEQGETLRYSGARDISSVAQDWQSREPAFRLFLDGSRRTYKIADIPIGTQVFPIIAAQVGVGVCKRENRRLAACDVFSYKRVVGVSKSFNPELAKLKNNKSAAVMIAKLEPYQRTPVAMYKTDRVEGKFAVWYVRLRKSRKHRG